jgi:hypothetical protein
MFLDSICAFHGSYDDGEAIRVSKDKTNSGILPKSVPVQGKLAFKQ